MREKRMIWQEFCYDLIEAREKDTTEDVYQELVESNLRQLGWSKVRGEICPKERINVGSHNQIEPDITIKLSDQPAFVIELKRPRNAITPRQEQQLLSYMRLRKTSFGLYIGDDIKLYYDTNENLPTEVWRTDLALDAASGEEFVDLFHHDTFSRQRIESLCHAQAHTIKTRQAMADFQQSLEADQDGTIRRVLTDYFVLQKRCDPAIVEEKPSTACTSPRRRTARATRATPRLWLSRQRVVVSLPIKRNTKETRRNTPLTEANNSSSRENLSERSWQSIWRRTQV